VLEMTSCLTCGSEDIAVRSFLDQEDIRPRQPGYVITYSHLAAVLCLACSSGHVENRQHDCFDVEDVSDEDEWYVLKLSPDMADRLAQQGSIPVSTMSGRWRFQKEEIDQWMEGQEVY